MPVYSLDDFDTKKGGVRKIVLEDGISKKLWIPTTEFVYKRIHYNLEKFTSFKDAKYKAVDCINQNYGEDGKGCPICEEIQELWKQWRALTNKDDKKELLNRINQMCSEEFWMNVIDLSDTEKLRYHACRFTMSKMKDIKRVSQEFGIDNVIWLFKMSKEGKKTTYTLTEDSDRKPLTDKLKSKLKAFNAREYSDGGPCDLESSLIFPRTMKEFMEILTGSVIDSDSEPEEELIEEEESVNLNDIIDDDDLNPGDHDARDDSLSLEDDSEQLSLEDEGLDLDLELEEEEEVPMVKITAIYIKESAKNKTLIEDIYGYFVKQNYIEEQETFKEKIHAVFNYVKTKTSVEIPENISTELVMPF